MDLADYLRPRNALLGGGHQSGLDTAMEWTRNLPMVPEQKGALIPGRIPAHVAGTHPGTTLWNDDGSVAWGPAEAWNRMRHAAADERAGILPSAPQDAYVSQPSMSKALGFIPIGETATPWPSQERRNAGDAFDVAGIAMTGGFAAPKPAGALGSAGGKIAKEPGFTAYHGSPHDFDRFDMSKIGTGEGAQAYGHGLYFAESEGVARSYRDNLSSRARAGSQSMEERLQNAGRMYKVRINADPDHFLDWDATITQQSEKVRSAIYDALPQDAKQVAANKAHQHEIDTIRSQITTGIDLKSLRKLTADRLADLTSRLTTLEADGPAPSADQYRLRGSQALRDIGVLDSPEVAGKLREAGIAGIKYLDAGSRGAGDGSRNYVVFDDKLIEILKKYGLLGPAYLGAQYGADNQENGGLLP